MTPSKMTTSYAAPVCSVNSELNGQPSIGARIGQNLIGLLESANGFAKFLCRQAFSPYWVLPAAIIASGCTRSVPNYLNESASISSYLDKATKIDYPDVVVPSLNEVSQAHAPITVIDPDFHSYYDLTLEDAISYGLHNSKVLRGYGTPGLQNSRVIPGVDNVINSPNAAGTIWNVAVRETEPGFIGTPGQIGNPGGLLTNTGLDINQGVESALADFDAYFASSLNFQKSDEPRNTVAANPLSPIIFQQDQFTWQGEVGKKTANGTQIFFRNANTYFDNNNPLAPVGLQRLDSWYRTSFEAEFRQPLLRGRGEFINRMPIVISRIGTDQEIANLEAQLQNLITNIEIRYWDLYLAYRNLDAAKKGRDAALETWKIIDDQFRVGAEVNVQQVAQAAQQYISFNSQVTEAFNQILTTQGQLRFLLGWSSTDGTILRPVDEPVMAQIEFSWCESLCEALTYRPELRQERWEIKKRELALAYAKNGLLPELNATALYRWLGLGDRFGTSSDNPALFPEPGSGALNELFGGNYQELSFGLDFRMPIGYRRELANVRNAQLKLAREIARLEDMELDATKELTEAFQALALNQQILQQTWDRWRFIKIEEEVFRALENFGVGQLDVALDAQQRLAQAEIAFFTSLTEYNKVISLIHRRKGTSLTYSGIEFAEGPWNGKAYLDAQEHARRRAASREINYGWSRPQVISQGEQWTPDGNVGYSFDAQAVPGASYRDGNRSIIAPGVLEEFPGETVPAFEAPTDNLTPTPSSNPRSSNRAVPGYRQTSQSSASHPVQTVSYQADVVESADLAGNANRPPSEPRSVKPGMPGSNANHSLNEPPRRASQIGVEQLRSAASGREETFVSNHTTPGDRVVINTFTSSQSPPVDQVQVAADWNRLERLGLNRPEQQGSGNSARIQIQQ